eukprot:CFRG3647T1
MSMLNTIKAIDKQSVHRICSGQVVVSLAIAAKELVENSIDAGATLVEIKLKNFGLDMLEVSDNGSGVLPSNYASLTLKHHTSKIDNFGDLSTIESFGFRGEALSSLCTLGKLSVTTKTCDEESGAKLEYDHNGRITSQTATPRTVGTTVSIEQLFSRLPVRMQQLQKNIKREFAKLLQMIQSYCIISTNVRIICTNQPLKGARQQMVSTGNNKSLLTNMINVFGAKQGREVSPVLSSDDGLKLKLEGLISNVMPANCGRGASDRQFFYVNGRPCDLVKVGKIVNDIYKAYNQNKYPVVVLNIVTEREECDVNVTPDKRTVYLHKEKAILELVEKTLQTMFEPSLNTYTVQTVQTSLGFKKITNSPSVETRKASITVRETELQKPCSETAKTEDDASISPGIPDEDYVASETETESVSTRESEGESECETRMSMDRMSSNWKPKIERNNKKRETPTCGLKRTNASSQEIDVEAVGEVWNSQFDNESGCEGRRGNVPVNKRVNMSPGRGTRTAQKYVRVGPAVVISGKKKSATKINTMVSPRRTSSDDEQRIYAVGEHESRLDRVYKMNLDNMRLASHEIDGGLHESDEYVDDKVGHSREISRTSKDIGHDVNIQLHAAHDTEVQAHEREQYNNHMNARSDKEDDRDVPDNFEEGNAGRVNTNCNNEEVKSYEEKYVDTDEPTVEGARVRLIEHTIPFDINMLTSSLKTVYAIHRQEYNTKSLAQTQNEKTNTTGSVGDGEEKGFNAAIAPNDNSEAEAELERHISKEDFSQMHVLGQFNLGFIIARLRNDLFIVDQHATDEIYNFESLQRTTKLDSQPLVIPKLLELTASQETVLMDEIAIFEKNGFKFVFDHEAPVGKRVRLSSLPNSKNKTFGLDDVEEMIHMLSENPGVLCRPTKVRKMFAMRACRKSIMIGTALEKAKMKQMLTHMGEIDLPWNCPHGRPTMRHLHYLGDKNDKE